MALTTATIIRWKIIKNNELRNQSAEISGSHKGLKVVRSLMDNEIINLNHSSFIDSIKDSVKQAYSSLSTGLVKISKQFKVMEFS